MVANEESSAVYGHKQSTAVPGAVTGGETVVYHELTNMDLIMKLHYLRAVYYFRQSEIIDGITITQLKEPMFPWLEVYYPVSGRIRRTEAGRPLVKCNDCGVRILEAKCNSTVDEWLALKGTSRWRHLVSDKVIGPDLHFSPLIYIQFTKFKCGGMAIGYSWAHILGDAISAINSINLWGQLVNGKPTPKSLQIRNPQIQKEVSTKQVPVSGKPLSVKQVEQVGDCWLISNNSTMSTHCLEITANKLKNLQSEEMKDVPPFETISALIWKCLAKIRVGREPKLITICRNDPSAKKSGILSNEQKIVTVTLNSLPSKVELSELAMLIAKQEIDESKVVEELVDKTSGNPDFVLYGANLTFIDIKGTDLHGLDLKGQKPIQVDYSIDGVGDEGAVLVFQSPQRSDDGTGHLDRTLMLILPEDQIIQLKEVLESEFGID